MNEVNVPLETLTQAAIERLWPIRQRLWQDGFQVEITLRQEPDEPRDRRVCIDILLHV